MIREIEEKTLARTSAQQDKKLRRLAILQAFENHAVKLKEKEKGYQQESMQNKTEDIKESSEEKAKGNDTENSQTDSDRPPAYAPEATNTGMYPILSESGWHSAEIKMTGGIKIHPNEVQGTSGGAFFPKEPERLECIQNRPSGPFALPIEVDEYETTGSTATGLQPQHPLKEHTNPFTPSHVKGQLITAGPTIVSHDSYAQPRVWEEEAHYETKRFSTPVVANYGGIDGVFRRVEGELKIESEEHARARQQEILNKAKRLEVELKQQTHDDLANEIERMEAELEQHKRKSLAKESERLQDREELRQKLLELSRDAREQLADTDRRAKSLLSWDNKIGERTIKTRSRSYSADHSPVESEDSYEESEDEPDRERKGRSYPRRSKRLREKQTAKQLSLLFKGLRSSYVPWSFMDLKGLTEQLPSINSGGQRWVTAFEERTAGHRLAIGDVKAILSQIVGKVKMENILSMAHMENMAMTQKWDKDRSVQKQEIFTQVKGATEGRTSTIDDERLKEVLPGDYVYVKTFKRGWSEPRREGPFEVILAMPTAVKVKGRKVWIHLNHCSRAPDLLRPVASAGPDQQQPHIAEDSGAGDQAVAGQSGVSQPITRSITRTTPPDDDDSE
ncbi:hypothetical protein SRHO_G00308100 [Serrasalmus rhombeus]